MTNTRNERMLLSGKSRFVAVNEPVNMSITQTNWTLYKSQSFTDLFTKLSIMVELQEMWLPIVFGGNPEYPSMSAKPEVGLIFTIAPNRLNAKYFENDKKYDIGLMRGQIRN